MTKMSRSPDRFSFQTRSLEKKLEKSNSPDKLDQVRELLQMYEDLKQRELALEEDESWKKINMGYDLCTTEWILAKVRSSRIYAQHLYAAMCNNSFQKLETWPILTDQHWSCTWRFAGGIIADMRQEGDYIDWYCSGIRGPDMDETDFQKLSKQEQENYLESRQYVTEMTVTEEIEQDLQRLGWRVIKDDNQPI